MSDKLQETLIKVKLKIAFAPLPLGGAGGGAQLRQREKQITCVRGLSARAGFFEVSTLSLRPSANTPASGRGIYLIRVSFSLFGHLFLNVTH
jgi:hypothetical protein